MTDLFSPAKSMVGLELELREAECIEKFFYSELEFFSVTLLRDIKYTFVTFTTQVLTSKETEN